MIIVFSMMIIIIIFFIIDIFPPDSVILIALSILVITGILTPQEAFKGFGSDFIIMLASIFIISAALEHNGVVEHLSRKLSIIETASYPVTILFIMIPVGLLSALMNNTTVAAMMVLPILSMSNKIKQSPSMYLMPMAFASLLGGTCTLIGTSTNIAGNNLLQSNNIEPIAMFEFLPIGLTLLVFCTLVFAFVGKHILPVRTDVKMGKGGNNERLFFTHFKIPVGGAELARNAFKELEQNGIQFLNINSKISNQEFSSDYLFEEGNDVYFMASGESIKVFYHKNQKGQRYLTEPSESLAIGEIMTLPTSFVVNSTINDSQFNQNTDLNVIGIFRKNHSFVKELGDVIIKAGDILIVQGPKEEINKQKLKQDFIVLTQKQSADLPNLKKGFIALGFFLFAIIIGTLNLVPMSIAFLAAVLVILSFNVLPAGVVYSKIDWRLIILIGGMTAFGLAIKKTGSDIYLAELITDLLSGCSSTVIMFCFMVLTVLLTQPMSNAAAALVVLPIAIQTANNMGDNPRNYAISVILSASISMITPFEPASLLVMGPGNYKIADFLKIGGLLTLACLIILTLMIGWIYG